MEKLLSGGKYRVRIQTRHDTKNFRRINFVRIKLRVRINSGEWRVSSEINLRRGKVLAKRKVCEKVPTADSNFFLLDTKNYGRKFVGIVCAKKKFRRDKL